MKTKTPSTETPKPLDPFTAAKRAQQKLDSLEAKRQSIRAELDPEALALLDALDEHRARQSIGVVPSEPEASE